MTGKMKNPNEYPEVVKSPTRYRGGMNSYPQVVQNPTRYRGGMNAAACDVSKYMKK